MNGKWYILGAVILVVTGTIVFIRLLLLLLSTTNGGQKQTEEISDGWQDYVPPCDTAITESEYLARKALLLNNNNNKWEYEREGRWIKITPINNLHKEHCAVGLRRRWILGASDLGNIIEEEEYKSGKELFVVSSDVPDGSVDTVCEYLHIEFQYCKRNSEYTLYSGDTGVKYWDGIRGNGSQINRATADSILHSWDIRRELPPEDHPWLYCEKQL